MKLIKLVTMPDCSLGVLCDCVEGNSIEKIKKNSLIAVEFNLLYY